AAALARCLAARELRDCEIILLPPLLVTRRPGSIRPRHELSSDLVTYCHCLRNPWRSWARSWLAPRRQGISTGHKRELASFTPLRPDLPVLRVIGGGVDLSDNSLGKYPRGVWRCLNCVACFVSSRFWRFRSHCPVARWRLSAASGLPGEPAMPRTRN